MNKTRLLLAAGIAAALSSAQAQGMSPQPPDGWYAQLGVAARGTQTATAGVVWPWEWRSQAAGAAFEGRTEAYLSAWNARGVGGGRQSLLQAGLVPVLRLRLDGGRSAWFAEAGIGLSVTSSVYRTPDKQFSTAFNFHDMLGVGVNFGADRSEELGLRIVHYSNAGIRKPNPGIEFLQLRYGRRF